MSRPRAADIAPERGRTFAGHARGHVGSGSRADSCTPVSDYMRHRVGRNWQAWADIGDGRRVVDMIRKGDGFYAVGIAPEDRDYFTVNYRGKLYRLVGLPMGWSMSP
eukprot:jgi/Tetstr1/445813/TSEL_033454.t1